MYNKKLAVPAVTGMAGCGGELVLSSDISIDGGSLCVYLKTDNGSPVSTDDVTARIVIVAVEDSLIKDITAFDAR